MIGRLSPEVGLFKNGNHAFADRAHRVHVLMVIVLKVIKKCGQWRPASTRLCCESDRAARGAKPHFLRDDGQRGARVTEGGDAVTGRPQDFARGVGGHSSVGASGGFFRRCAASSIVSRLSRLLHTLRRRLIANCLRQSRNSVSVYVEALRLNPAFTRASAPNR